jgi:hypothetical protein
LEYGLRDTKRPKTVIVDPLASEDIRHFDKEIRRMSRAELIENFRAVSSGRVLQAQLIKNIIWQAYERICDGKEPKIKGNIRTFWYLWIKPALARLPDDEEMKTDPYVIMTKLFAELVLDRKLFKYSDFDFTDENWENRRIGTSKPEILIFAEKRGWIRFLKELHEEFGVSILALGGFPSALTSEYTARDVKAVLNGKQSPHLIGIVDYDPSGDLIAHAFQNQLEATGFPKSSLTTVIHPKHYTKDELEIFKYRLPKTEKTKLDKWLELTKGIDGKPYGLESESMPIDRLKLLIRNLIEDLNIKKMTGHFS